MFSLFTLLMANTRERPNVYFYEVVGYFFTNCKTYVVDVYRKSLSFNWNSSNNIDNDIDVFNIALAKRV